MNKTVKTWVGLMVLVTCPAAMADEFRPQTYLAVGAGLGKATDLESFTRDEQRYLANLGMSNEAEVRDLSVGYKLTLGYQATPWWALESHFAWLGRYSAEIRGRSSRAALNEQFEAKAYGAGVSALLMAPVHRDLGVFAKVGMFRSFLDASIKATGVGGNYSDSFSTRTTRPMWGAGVQVRSWGSVIRLEYESYQDVGRQEDVFDGSQVNMVTLSSQFSF